jgi:hypothetical protein
VFFFIAFLNSPCYETPKNAIKQIEQNNRGREKKNRKQKTKATSFVMSPDGFLWIFVFVFLNPPCYETPKNAIKKSIKK